MSNRQITQKKLNINKNVARMAYLVFMYARDKYKINK